MLLRMWRKGTPLTLLVGMYISAATVANSRKVPQKLKTELPHAILAILLLSIYRKKLKTLTQKDMCTSLFIAALFPVAKVCKQSKCLSTDGKIKKIWCIYAMEYCSANKKRIKVFPFCNTDGPRDCLCLVKKVKDKYCVISLICGI